MKRAAICPMTVNGVTMTIERLTTTTTTKRKQKDVSRKQIQAITNIYNNKNTKNANSIRIHF